MTSMPDDDAEWVVVADAAPGPGEILADDDHDVVVWTTFDGMTCVMDGRCPHEWSHLGAEGVVDGDELVCAAHFWRFTTAGTGTKLNVKGRRDAKGDIEVFPSRVEDGRVMAKVRNLMLLVMLSVAVLFAAGPTGRAAAQTSDAEQITDYNSAMTVNRDGSLDVTEHITYDFGATPHHGIFRYVPNRAPYTGKGPDSRATYDRVTPITNIQVSSDAPSNLSTKDENDNLVMQIGDPNQTVIGVHTYVISYRIRGVFNRFPDHDELNFNVTGLGWPVPILKVEAAVEGPVDPTQTTCFAGPLNSQLPCTSHAIDGNTAHFTQTDLQAGEGLTVVVAYPKNTVNATPILEEVPTIGSAFRPTGQSVGIGLVLLLIGGGLVGLLLWRNGRDRRFRGSAVDAAFSTSGDEERVPFANRSVDPVEFVPPDNIRPGHMGTLWDEEANAVDVVGMMIDLAVRGYFRIEELEAPHRSSFGFGQTQGDYRFVKLKDPDDTLLHSEQVLLESLFRDGDRAQLSDLQQHFAQRLALVEGALYDDAVAAGWFPTRPDRVRANWKGIGLVVTVVGLGLVFLAFKFTHLALAAVAVPAVGLLIIGLNHRFPARTPKGTALLGRVRGFRELFAAGEGERQAFLEKKELFSQYLPYAIVFGMADQWAKRFADLGLSPEEMGVGGWYMSPYGYNPITFAYAMSSFSTISAGSFAMAAPSSTGAFGGAGGFGGGGFSGGGFGGGGGGSW
jgi:nitrite reductase/ring-hydroxylating ferredoxin subunit